MRSHSCFYLHNILTWRQRFHQEGIEQAVAGVVGVGEASLQPVAQRHQFINLGDDALLLGVALPTSFRPGMT